MNYVKSFGILMVLVLFAGCSGPKIDSSSDIALEASLEKIRAKLSEDEQDEFNDALRLLLFSQFDLSDFIDDAVGINDSISKARRFVDGKTAKQVIAEANRIRSERAERERQEALEEIRVLELKQAVFERDLTELRKFEVLDSSFGFIRQRYGGPRPEITLKIKNDTNHSVSKAVFMGTLASPGRSVPWHRDTFNFKFPGGIEPGEKASWSLELNPYSDWADVHYPPDETVFIVHVLQIYGPDEEPIFSGLGFDDDDLTRLQTLKEVYGVE